ncbi:MAG: hypothetical protein R2991_07065 [Thermoanaerobaculia bacterium]
MPAEQVLGRWSARRLVKGLRTELAKKLGLGHSADELSAALAQRELLFRAPTLTPSLVKAIRAITPQFKLRCDETSRRVWELSQNGSCWGEMDALEPLLHGLGRPRRVLEIGPGLGRSTVFLKRRLGWEDVPFDLFEGNGPAHRYPLLAPRSADSFRGDLEALAAVLEHNGTREWRLIDAGPRGGRLVDLEPPYDLVYSFYGVGFHWRLEDFWEEILPLLGTDGVGIFTVWHAFETFPELARLPHGFLTIRRILAKDRPVRLLVVSPERDRVAPFVEAEPAT